MGHSAARGDQALHGPGEMLERFMPGGGGNARYGAGADHPALQLRNFGKGGLDRVLDGANLGGDLQSGGFDHLFAHDFSFPSTRNFPRRAMDQQ
jgi:hypothetical protein